METVTCDSHKELELTADGCFGAASGNMVFACTTNSVFKINLEIATHTASSAVDDSTPSTSTTVDESAPSTSTDGPMENVSELRKIGFQIQGVSEKTNPSKRPLFCKVANFVSVKMLHI